MLRQGRLTSGLRYSGLGFTALPPTKSSPPRYKGLPGTGRRSRSVADQLTAKRNLDKANHEAEQADTQVEAARQAVKKTAAELSRLKSVEALAVRQSKQAHTRASAAKKKLNQ